MVLSCGCFGIDLGSRFRFSEVRSSIEFLNFPKEGRDELNVDNIGYVVTCVEP